MNQGKFHLVAQIIELEMNIPEGSIRGPLKKRDICNARLVFLGLMKQIKEYKAKACAEYLSRSESEVNHLIRVHRNLMQVDKQYQDLFERMRTQYKANLPNLNDVELIELREHLNRDMKRIGLQLIRVNETLVQRGIQSIVH